MTERHSCVVGAGLMGRELAGLLAVAGHSVTIIDVDENALTAARGYHQSNLVPELEAAGYAPDDGLRERFTYAASIEAANIDDVSFAIEAVTEHLEIKREVVDDLESAIADDGVIGTNTSSLTAKEIAEGMTRSERLVLFHFANPAIAHDLVEIAGERASASSIERARTVADAIDHWWIQLERERRGNGLSRLSAAVKCAGTWELRRSSAAAVEQAARAVGFETGPIALIDSIGIDVHLATVDNLAVEYGDRFAAPPDVRGTMEALVEKGDVGKKAGTGFFEWTDDGPVLPETDDDADVTPVIAALVNEAHEMVADGITDREGIDAILKRGSGGDVGPFDLESMFGAADLVEVLEERYDATGAAIYRPAPTLREQAELESSE